jgi:uncharacterized membrane protein YdcZ (DUF606 family)
MTQLVPLLVTLVIGIGGATQAAMLGAVGRERGGAEATWLSLLGTALGLAIILGVRALRGDPPLLPAPFDRAPTFVVVGALSAVGLAVTMRGLEPYYAVTGLFGLAFIVVAATLAPKLGIALFLSALITGQLIGGLTLDQLGAFGNDVHRITVLRIAGVAALLLGVALVRSG